MATHVLTAGKKLIVDGVEIELVSDNYKKQAVHAKMAADAAKINATAALNRGIEFAKLASGVECAFLGWNHVDDGYESFSSGSESDSDIDPLTRATLFTLDEAKKIVAASVRQPQLRK